MKHDIVNYVGCGTGWIVAAISSNEVYQVIEIVLALISTLVTVFYTIWKWYKKANEDGEITDDEKKELVEDIKDAVKGEDEDDN